MTPQRTHKYKTRISYNGAQQLTAKLGGEWRDNSFWFSTDIKDWQQGKNVRSTREKEPSARQLKQVNV